MLWYLASDHHIDLPSNQKTALLLANLGRVAWEYLSLRLSVRNRCALHYYTYNDSATENGHNNYKTLGYKPPHEFPS